MPEAAVDLASQPVQQRVIDRDQHQRAGLGEPLDDQHRQPQPELVRRPASIGKEPVCTGVMPHRGQARADQHPADRPPGDLGDLANDQRAEGPQRETRKAWREQEQKLIQRR